MHQRLVRRLVTVPTTVLMGVIAVAAAPLTFGVAALRDHGRPWQSVRLVALVTGALVIEICGMIAAMIGWIITGCGLFRKQRWTWHVHRHLLGRYTAALLALTVHVLGTHIEWRTKALPDGPIIVLARHTSFFDALIPATIVARHHARLPHHVVTKGLRYLPCIDIVGHRLPTLFISRATDTSGSERPRVTRLAEQIDERGAAIIFPEGTFRTDERFHRSINWLRENHPDGADRADRAEKLRHVLAPRSSGARALAQGSPSATVVVCANTGFEPFATLSEIMACLVAERPIIVETWTTKNVDVPRDADRFDEWLFSQYEQLDEWVECVSGPTRPNGSGC